MKPNNKDEIRNAKRIPGAETAATAQAGCCPGGCDPEWCEPGCCDPDECLQEGRTT